MNGSGVVALDVGDGSSRIILYSQHYNGEIRRSEYLDGTWTGAQHADVVEVVASNARNGTPLMAVSFVRHQELIVSFDSPAKMNRAGPADTSQSGVSSISMTTTMFKNH